MNINDLYNKESEGELKTLEAKISFSKKDAVDIHPNNDNLMVITFWCDEWEMKRNIVNQGNTSMNLMDHVVC